VSIEPFRFLHTGDPHLDSCVKGLSSEAPPDADVPRARRRPSGTSRSGTGSSNFTGHPWIAELLDAGGGRTISLG
jgi:hypothetical protein